MGRAMCPIWPLHIVILYILALCPIWVMCQSAPNLLATFKPNNLSLHMAYYDFIDVEVKGDGLQPADEFQIKSRNHHVAYGDWNSTYRVDEAASNWKGRFQVTAEFLGRTDLYLEVKRGTTEFPVNGTLPVTVLRPQRVIDTIFTTSVAVFVSLIFINFGCAMDWPTVKECVRRPIGPIIGLCGQFVFMPLMCFGLGFLIFPTLPEMHLGMFCTGVAPGGGASNIWTFVLGGNLNLSLAMTTISTLSAFGFMPLWLFSLGQLLFRNANIAVPYQHIGMFVAGLVVPLAIGLAMQKFTPRLSAFMVRILKGFSTLLLLFIIVFAIITNLYIFELFTWEIIVAGMGVPWLGYIFGYLAGRVCRQPHADALAISIETGITNTGIAIFLLRYTLPQPEADLTTVVPVSVAIMTPFPMMAIYIYQKIKACMGVSKSEERTRKSSKRVTPASYPGSPSPQSSLPLMSSEP
ncbi:PREDICTED: ileal sodium/bile acid cotransporter-like isoform X2 [Papilio xuthus]|uniref:Ileal sodium/bile acid cotransporter-like isoform X1 n=2 Tax=Papilio xuthus TaxID=66420 RepID=A0AAJ6Z5A5_PAPXU|nr:PREDICTED: ileal sodium/bile acid cotransporter-like isoform X1 [Papilio xuthus]XP_013165653.1 PREDICTED: ileal sodium/bile acid cotransporter-like isoform X2 [Papilio xuthus]